MYPGIEVDSSTVIESNCHIVCVDGGKLNIKNSHISKGVHLFADVNSSIVIDNCFVGSYTHIAAKQSIEIGYGTLIAEMVVIRDQDHLANLDNVHSPYTAYNARPVHIGKHAWIASKATILKGVSIGDYAVVAASAVVTKAVPSKEIWGGIPARFIKMVQNDETGGH